MRRCPDTSPQNQPHYFSLWYQSCPSWQDCGHGRRQPKNKNRWMGVGGRAQRLPPDAGSHALFTPMSLHEYALCIDFEVGTNPTVRVCAVVPTHHLRTNHIISHFGTSHVLLGKTVAMGGGNLKMSPSPRRSSSPFSSLQTLKKVVVLCPPPQEKKKVVAPQPLPPPLLLASFLPTKSLRSSSALPPPPRKKKEVVVPQPLPPPLLLASFLPTKSLRSSSALPPPPRKKKRK